MNQFQGPLKEKTQSPWWQFSTHADEMYMSIWGHIIASIGENVSSRSGGEGGDIISPFQLNAYWIHLCELYSFYHPFSWWKVQDNVQSALRWVAAAHMRVGIRRRVTLHSPFDLLIMSTTFQNSSRFLWRCSPGHQAFCLCWRPDGGSLALI